ncbi:MAG: sulfotransferase [Candidatus Paceibacterota bacterium]|jgi:hypothetical protein
MNQKTAYSPILITGIERSGSSIVAKIINKCGAYSGVVNEMHENVSIKAVVDWYYRERLLISEKGQKPLPNTRRLPSVPDWRVSISTLLLDQGYTGQQTWLYKSSRIAQIWPIWNQAYPNAKWIIVRRRTGDIIQSCLKTGFMKAYSDQVGWLGWIHEHEKLFVAMIEKGLNCKVIWPERMATGDFEQMQETIEWLGLEWNDKIPEMIQPLFKNSLQKERSL